MSVVRRWDSGYSDSIYFLRDELSSECLFVSGFNCRASSLGASVVLSGGGVESSVRLSQAAGAGGRSCGVAMVGSVDSGWSFVCDGAPYGVHGEELRIGGVDVVCVGYGFHAGSTFGVSFPGSAGLLPFGYASGDSGYVSMNYLAYGGSSMCVFPAGIFRVPSSFVSGAAASYFLFGALSGDVSGGPAGVCVVSVSPSLLRSCYVLRALQLPSVLSLQFMLCQPFGSNIGVVGAAGASQLRVPVYNSGHVGTLYGFFFILHGDYSGAVEWSSQGVSGVVNPLARSGGMTFYYVPELPDSAWSSVYLSVA